MRWVSWSACSNGTSIPRAEPTRTNTKAEKNCQPEAEPYRCPVRTRGNVRLLPPVRLSFRR
jgi:hypothetical protein